MSELLFELRVALNMAKRSAQQSDGVERVRWDTQVNVLETALRLAFEAQAGASNREAQLHGALQYYRSERDALLDAPRANERLH